MRTGKILLIPLSWLSKAIEQGLLKAPMKYAFVREPTLMGPIQRQLSRRRRVSQAEVYDAANKEMILVVDRGGEGPIGACITTDGPSS